MSPVARGLSGAARAIVLAAAAVAIGGATAGCGSSTARPDGQKSIVVTYSVLGAAVSELVGDSASVTVLIPNGSDMHQWAPSARDIETLTHADIVVENGLNLEAGAASALEQARDAGVADFVASDHVVIRHVGAGEGVPGDDPDQAAGAADPHLWLDPLSMRDVVAALAAQFRTDLGLDVSARAADLERRLQDLDTELRDTLAVVPQAQRKLVTGHESLGYFADRYGFTVIGAIVPSLSDQAETSSADLAALEAAIRDAGVKAVFAEVGTSPATADAVSRDTGARVVELNTHRLPDDGSYATFMRELASTIVGGLK